MLALVVVHGFFWSGLLSASAAYITDSCPLRAARKASATGACRQCSRWPWRRRSACGSTAGAAGLAMCLEAASLNLVMAAIAWRCPASRPGPQAPRWRPFAAAGRVARAGAVVHAVPVLRSATAGSRASWRSIPDANGVTPRALYFTVFCRSRSRDAAVHRTLGRSRRLSPRVPAVPRPDRRRLRAAGDWRQSSRLRRLGADLRHRLRLGLSGVPGPRHAFVADDRRGAAFGSIIGAFDTGIGTGSIAMGWIIEHYGFQPAWATAAVARRLRHPVLPCRSMERRVVISAPAVAGDSARSF